MFEKAPSHFQTEENVKICQNVLLLYALSASSNLFVCSVREKERGTVWRDEKQRIIGRAVVCEMACRGVRYVFDLT